MGNEAILDHSGLTNLKEDVDFDEILLDFVRVHKMARMRRRTRRRRRTMGRRGTKRRRRRTLGRTKTKRERTKGRTN